MQIRQQSTRERRKRVKKNALKPNGSQIVYERQTYNKRVWKRQTEIKRGKKENANVKQISNGREKKNVIAKRKSNAEKKSQTEFERKRTTTSSGLRELMG